VVPSAIVIGGKPDGCGGGSAKPITAIEMATGEIVIMG
jgi:hypothetical protein